MDSTARTHRHTFRLSDEENARFLDLLKRSGAHTKTKFILGQLFDREFRVVTTDATKHKYYLKLCDFHRQFRGLANNYNQVTRRIHTAFDERYARHLLHELRKTTAKIGTLMEEILRNIEEVRAQW